MHHGSEHWHLHRECQVSLALGHGWSTSACYDYSSVSNRSIMYCVDSSCSPDTSGVNTGDCAEYSDRRLVRFSWHRAEEVSGQGTLGGVAMKSLRNFVGQTVSVAEWFETVSSCWSVFRSDSKICTLKAFQVFLLPPIPCNNRFRYLPWYSFHMYRI